MEFRAMTRAELPGWYTQELCEAFPPNERKPLETFYALIDAGRYDLLGLYGGEVLLGYAGMWSNPDWPDYVLLDQLGVTAAKRGCGLGREILAQLEARCRGRVCTITEAECPVPGAPPEENDLRRRRIAFYERAGFCRTYEMGACGVRFQTLVLGPAGEERALMKAHRAIYGPERTDVKVPVRPDEALEAPYWMNVRAD